MFNHIVSFTMFKPLQAELLQNRAFQAVIPGTLNASAKKFLFCIDMFKRGKW